MSVTIVSFGAGDNSGAMLLGMYERGIRPDAILFADTGGEKPNTYRFIWTFQRWLEEHAMPSITIVVKGGIKETLEESLLRGAVLPSIVYGLRKCSQKFKMEPQEKWTNHWRPARQAWEHGEQVTKAIGFHAGEPHRAKGAQDPIRYREIYPLIEWNWGREECLAAFARHGLEPAGKSACFFCPSSKKREVFWLRREHPDLYERAVAIERNAAPNLTNVRGLGRRWSWEDIVAADDAQMKMFPEAPEMPCMCADGGEE